MDDWTKDCEDLDFINVDICFCINEDFYYGPLDVESIAERKQTTPLPSVTNKSATTFNLRSLKAEDYPEKLLAYYREVLRLAKNYGKKDIEIGHYFWLKLYFWRPDKGISMNFPWYDTLDQMLPILEKIASTEEGVLIYDEDQDWEVEIIARDEYIYAREGNPEEDELNILHKIPRGPLAQDCVVALDRAKNLIVWLSDELDNDYWTKSKYPEDLFEE
jgi:hypothetical protein